MTDYESERTKERLITIERSQEARRVAQEKERAILLRWELKKQHALKSAGGSLSEEADKYLNLNEKAVKT